MTSPAQRAPSSAQRAGSSPVGQPVEETGGVEVAGAGGVDHGRYRGGRHGHRTAGGQHDRAEPPRVTATSSPVSAAASRAASNVDDPKSRTISSSLPKSTSISSTQEVEELSLVPLDAERVGEREGDRAVVVVGDGHGPTHRLLGRREVPQVALEIDDLGPGDQVGRYVVGGDGGRRAEVGGHRAFGVAAHEDEAPAGAERRSRRRRRLPPRRRHRPGWPARPPRRPRLGRNGRRTTGCRGRRPARADRRRSCRRTRPRRRGRRRRPSCWPRSRRRPRRSGPWPRRCPRPGRDRRGPSSPRTSPVAAISSSVAVARTSTSGEPTPTTSSGYGSAGRESVTGREGSRVSDGSLCRWPPTTPLPCPRPTKRSGSPAPSSRSSTD